MMLLSLADIFDTGGVTATRRLLRLVLLPGGVQRGSVHDLLGDGGEHDDNTTNPKPSLELDDPERGAVVAALKRVKVAAGDDVMEHTQRRRKATD